jgi:GNAT superfamily N-acetyltransferase
MTTTTTDRRDFLRALEMERAMLGAAAQRTESHPLGVLLFDDVRARVWVHNQLHVTGPAGDVDDLVAILDAHYAHLPHRRVVVEDEAEGERLAEGFRGRGWQVETTVFMALREPRDREPDDSLATEVGAAELQRVERESLTQDGRDAELRELLIDARAAGQAVADEARFVAGVVGDRHVGATTLYVRGDVAQVEDVATLRAFRGRGVARAMVSLATDLAGGAGLVWIAADDDDWPKQLYFKLGYRAVGRTFSFTRVGPEHPAHDARAR